MYTPYEWILVYNWHVRIMIMMIVRIVNVLRRDCVVLKGGGVGC